MGRRACRAGLLLWRLRLTPPPYRSRRGLSTMGNYLGKQTRLLRRHERRPSHTHTAAPVLGPRAATPGVAANPGPSVDVSYCELCSADGSSPWS